MKSSLFDFTDYKKYLRELCDVKGRGFRKELALATQCQTAYISHVLNQNAHFNWEQAEAASSWIGHSALETEYFLNLIEYHRAGTKSLRRFLEQRLSALRDRNLSIQERIQVQEKLTREAQASYYSVWYHAAVHVLLTLPAMRTVNALAQHLQLSPRLVKGALDFLCSVGLANLVEGQYVPGPVALHLDADSPMISKHHSNWRLQAIRNLELQREEELHFSSVFTLSAADAKRIKEGLVAEIQRTVKRIKASPEEIGCAMTVDFWRV